MGLFDGSSARKQSLYEFDAYNKLAKQNEAAAAAQSAMLQGQLGAGRDAALGQYAGLEGRLAGILSPAYDQARAGLQGASDRFDPFYNTGVSANTLYGNALGVGGTGGSQDAFNTFKQVNEPLVNRALDDVQRRLSASGQSQVGGNTYAALADRSRDMQNDQWKDWLGGLNTLSGRGFQAAGAQAGLTGQMGDLLTGQAKLNAGFANSITGDRAGLISDASNRGVQTAANLWASANDAANRDYTAGITGASRGFTAGDDAQGRALGAGLGIAKIAASIGAAPFTGGTSLAGLGSTGFNLFGDTSDVKNNVRKYGIY